MKTTNLKYFSALFGAALLGGTLCAQAQTDFPRTGVDAASCQDVDWNSEMVADYPRLIQACQEVISVDGIDWARFEARFNRVNSDGTVNFKIRNGNRALEDITFKPASGQVAYINDRPVEFRDLTTRQQVNLYVPEGEYGFSTSVDTPIAELAVVVPEDPEAEQRIVEAQPEESRTLLPATASNLPWIGLGGLLMMLTSLGMLAFRRNG